MATKKEAKIKFTAETGEFNNSIKTANSTLTQLRSELKLNATQMKGAGESAELLSQRQDILAQEAEASQQKIQALSDKLQKAKDIFGDNSVEAQKLQTQLNNARVAEAKIQQEITQANSALERHEAATREADSALGRLESTIREQESRVSSLEGEYKSAVIQFGKASTEARQLESQLSKANSELQESKSKMNQAEQAAKELSGSFDKAAKEADDLGASVGDIAAGNMIADFATSAIDSLTGLEESTRQYRSEQAKLAAIADTSGQSFDGLKSQYQDLYAITADETLSSTAVANLSAMNLSTENLDKALNIATGSWAQFGDSIPIDGLYESLNESSKLGATLTGPVVDAINWCSMSQEEWSAALSGNADAQKAFNAALDEGLTVEDAMNAALAECSTEQERQDLLLNALNQGYSELAGSYSETNKAAMDANRAQAELTDAQAKLAEEIAPLQTAVTDLASGGLSWLADNFKIVAPLTVALAVGFAGLWLVMNGATIITTVKNAFLALNAVMKANPVGIVITIIAMLVVAFIGLWNTCEPFRNFFINLWEGIKNAVGNAVEGIKTWFTDMKNNVSNIFNSVKNTAVNVWNGIKTAVMTPVNAVRTTVSNVFNTVKSTVSGVFNSIKSTATSVWNGIKNAIMNPINTAKETVGNAIQAIKDFFNVKLEFPKIKLPHIKVSGGEVPWGIGGVGTAPKIDIEWYAKGGILTKPTIFGASGNKVLAGGEAGHEAVLPISVLQDYIDAAFQRNIFAYAGEGGGDVYNIYFDNVKVNDNEEMREVTKDYITDIIRLGDM